MGRRDAAVSTVDELAEWTFSESGLAASRKGKHTHVELEIDGSDLEVRIDDGHGYGALSLYTFVPLEVVRRLLAAVQQSGVEKQEKHGT